MNIYNTIKAAVTTRQAAEHFGLAANNTPEWVDGKKINEVLFCEDFLKDYPRGSLNGTFFTVDGLVFDENLLKKKIYDFLKPYVSTGLPKKVSNLLEVLRMECCTEDLPLQQTLDAIPEEILAAYGSTESKTMKQEDIAYEA